MSVSRKLGVLVCIFVLAICISIVQADRWSMPTEKIFYSDGGEFTFKVIPSKKVEGNRIACKGILSKRGNNGEDIIVWSEQLENNKSPVNAIVSSTGRYVITFDEWGQKGYGDNVVVIYGQDGKLLHKFGLEDILTEKELLQVEKSVSSRHWAKGEHLIDEKRDILILRTISEKRIDLKTGKIFEKKVNLLRNID